MTPTLPCGLALAAMLAPVCAQVPDFYDMDTVRDIRLQFSQANWWTQLTNNYAPEINIAADMTVDGRTYANVGVRFRGNTSYTMLPQAPNQGWEKKSFNIEMDWMVPGQDIYGYDSLNLNNGYHDPTFLREALSYMVMRRHGVAPKANWVRLWLNGTYWGVYINVQQPNKDMMKEWFRSNDGNRYRCFPTSGGFSNGRCCFTWLGSNVALYLAAYQAKQGDGTDLMQMCNILNNTPTASLQAALRPVFNVDAFYRYAAVMNVTTNTDSYLQSGKDHFLYMDEVHGDATTFPFDLNEAMEGSATLDPWYMTTNVYRPAFTKTLQFPEWRERYKAHLRSVVMETFNPTFLSPIAQRYHAMIAPDVIADTKKIYSTTAFQNNLTQTVTISGQPSTVPGLLPLIQNRYNYLSTHADLSAPRAVLSNLAHSPAQPNPTQQITFTVQASSNAAIVWLWWRALGPFQSTPMYDDGAHGDGAAGDGIYGAILPAQSPGSRIDYYAEAATATNLRTFLPFTAELEREAPKLQVDWQVIPSPIRINEFVAQNNTGIVDEMGQHEDWVELYNDSASPVMVGGMKLSDSLLVQKFTIPAGTTIPAHGTLLIWCDEDGTQGPLHANFKLSASGEHVVLYSANGLGVHDRITFGPQVADQSTARARDGQLPWVTFPAPTPLAANELASCGQRAYAALEQNRNGMVLFLNGAPRIGSAPLLGSSNGPANSVVGFAIGLEAAHIDLAPYGLAGEVLLVDPNLLSVLATVPVDGQRNAATPLVIPNLPILVGYRVHLQALGLAAAAFDTSNGLMVVICP